LLNANSASFQLYHGENKLIFNEIDLPQVTGNLYHKEITLVLLPINNSQATTLNTKYIWAVLIKLHDSATYDDRRRSYEWLKHKVLEIRCVRVGRHVYPRTVVLVS
jgi:hypothetical protein